MPIAIRRVDGHSTWGVWKMDETDEASLLPSLPDPQLVDEVFRLFPNSHSRRMERLCSRALLYQLGDISHVAYHSTGSPYVPDDSRHISISHTRGYAAAIISDRKTAIDIEQYGERVRRVRSHFIRDDEEIRPYQGTDIWSLLLHWSAKETLYKYLDLEGVDLIRHLRVLPFTPQPQGTFTAQELKTPQQETVTIHYRLHPDYVLTMIL